MAANSNINCNATNNCVKLSQAAAQKAKQLADVQKGSARYQTYFTEWELARQQDYADTFLRLFEGNGGEPKITTETKKAYAAGMKILSETYPDDLDAATLYADALMNIDPWKWWNGNINTRDDVIPTEVANTALQVLNKVIFQDPDHIGANHFFIHGIEEGPFSDAALPMAERLRWLAPSSGHLVVKP